MNNKYIFDANYKGEQMTTEMFNNYDTIIIQSTTGTGKTIFVKIYPYNYSVQGDVVLYAENANAVTVSPTVPAPFAAATPQPSGGIPGVSLWPLSALAATVIVLILRR